MAKYTRKQKELIENWDAQIDFLKSSIEIFDKGKVMEAIRIAQTLRVMFHNTEKSHSIYERLNNNIIFKSSSGLYSPFNLISSWMLLSVELSSDGISYQPKLDNPVDRLFFYDFEDWWNQVIFDDKKNVFSRKDIVVHVANKDGGAHFDDYIPEKYANLIIYNSLGVSDMNGSISNNPMYMAIRVIAQEVIDSVELENYSKKRKSVIIPRSSFEVRFLDENEVVRFTWSSTDIQQGNSEDQKSILSKFKLSKRKLFYKYFGDKKVEYITK